MIPGMSFKICWNDKLKLLKPLPSDPYNSITKHFYLVFCSIYMITYFLQESCFHGRGQMLNQKEQKDTSLNMVPFLLILTGSMCFDFVSLMPHILCTMTQSIGKDILTTAHDNITPSFVVWRKRMKLIVPFVLSQIIESIPWN